MSMNPIGMAIENAVKRQPLYIVNISEMKLQFNHNCGTVIRSFGPQLWPPLAHVIKPISSR